MLNLPQHPQYTAAKRCAFCGGKFGLVRHYSWRSHLCSRNAPIASSFAGKATADGFTGFAPPGSDSLSLEGNRSSSGSRTKELA